jgi:hypothetical protein
METFEKPTTASNSAKPYDPFVSQETYRKDLYRPMKVPGDPLDDVVGWVELRALNAGDRAEFNELKVSAEGEAGIQVGMIQLLMVDRAIVSWSFERAQTVQAIIDLEPDVFDQIWGHVSMGNPTLADAIDEIRNEGEPDPLDLSPADAEPTAAPDGESV